MTIAAVLSGGARWHIACEDYRAFAARIPDGAVNLLWLDGPYAMGKAAWDVFPSVAAFLDFYREVLDVSRRVLAPNGSLYLCNSTAMTARLELLVDERFEVLNSIRWAKPEGATKAEMSTKEAFRAFWPSSEAVIFAEHKSADGYALGADGFNSKCDEARGCIFEPLRAYLDGERMRAGVDKVAVNVALGFSATPGGMASRHYFSRSQWWLPTAEHYAAMQRLFNANGSDFLTRPYADLSSEYDFLHRSYEAKASEFDSLRRPFTISAAVPYTDTWTYATVGTQDGKHPCEKPAAMLRDVVAASSRPGDLVCSFFGGSFVEGEQALLQDRRFIGCDSDPEWGTVRGPARLRRVELDPVRAGRPIKGGAGVDPAQGRLL